MQDCPAQIRLFSPMSISIAGVYVGCACRIRYDGMALHCSLLHCSVVYRVPLVRKHKTCNFLPSMTVARNGSTYHTLLDASTRICCRMTLPRKKITVTAPETANSTAWNHIYNFSDEIAPHRGHHKLLPLCLFVLQFCDD